MALRLPLQTVLDKTWTSATPGSDSVAGVVAQTFFVPQDIDGGLMKVYAASVSGTGNVRVLLQTTDDGGTTWYDVVSSNIINGNSQPTSVLNGTALWAAVPVTGLGTRSTSTGASSTVSGTTQISVLGVTGNAASSTLAANQYSGLPLMSTLARVCLIYSGAITTNDGVKVQIKVNSQSATA